MQEYKLSFTSNSLNFEETLKILEIYTAQKKNWNVTQDLVVSKNILQRKKEKTITREFREIKLRLNNLTDAQLSLLLESDVETQKLIILLAIAKTYKFVKEFIVEVIRYKFILFQNVLFDSDYESYYSDKAAVYEKLDLIKDSTKNKIRSVLFTILTQAGLLNSTKEKIIIQPFLLPQLIKAVVKDHPELLKIFLVPDLDIQNYKEKYG